MQPLIEARQLFACSPEGVSSFEAHAHRVEVRHNGCVQLSLAQQTHVHKHLVAATAAATAEAAAEQVVDVTTHSIIP
jgi:hypothetical protein